MGLEDILPPAEDSEPEKKIASNGVDELVAAPDPKDQSSSVSETPTELSTPSVVTADLTESAKDTQPVPSQDVDPNTEVSKESNDSPKEQSAPITQEPEPSNNAGESDVKTEYDRVTNLLLARMAPVGLGDNFKILIYGPPGGTKSTFLNIPNNLIYDQEGGLVSILSWSEISGEPIAENCMSLPFTTLKQAEVLIERLQNRHNIPALAKFDVLSIDTMNDLSNKSLMEIIRKRYNRLPPSLQEATSEYVPDEDNSDYKENNNRMMEFVRRLRDLDMNIILTAHSKTVEPKGRPSKTYPDFSESLASKIEAMMDIVGYIEMQTHEVDGESKEFPVIRVQGDASFHCKTRIPLPSLIANPKYMEMFNAWEELKKKQANR